MSALRKVSEPNAAPLLRERPRPAGDHAAVPSPARMLHDQLSARLEELAQGDSAIMAEPRTLKLPVPVRAAVIVGTSLSLWGMGYIAATALL